MGWTGTPPPFYPSAEHNARDRCALSEVLPQLYLTNFKGGESAESLKGVGCTHVAAVGDEFVENSDNAAFGAMPLQFWNADITDDEHQGEAMADSLRSAALFIKKAIDGGGTVVVHCAAGISRSATVVLGYFLLYRKETLREAFARVITARPCVWPNEVPMTGDARTARRLIRLWMASRSTPL